MKPSLLPASSDLYFYFQNEVTAFPADNLAQPTSPTHPHKVLGLAFATMFVSGASNGETIGFAVGQIVMLALCLALYGMLSPSVPINDS